MESANGRSLSATDFTNANVIALQQTDLSATLAADTNFTISHQALVTSLTGQQNWMVQTQASAAVNSAQQVAGQTVAAASTDSFVFAAQDIGNFGREAAEDLVFGVDDPPVTLDLLGFGGKSLHGKIGRVG